MSSLPVDDSAPLDSPVSGNYSFYTAHSLCQYIETPTETNSLESENMCNFRRPTGSSSTLASCPDRPTTSSEFSESRIYTTHVTSRECGTSTGASGQRHNLQNLMERSPRIIAVMGPTGAGKSTFVKTATGADDVRIGHKLLSCTDEVRAVRCHHPSKDGDIVLVDTPGFDDTFKSDAQILEEIADWLKDTYQAGVKLSGVLYLHRITDNRITNTIVRNLDMFQKLCGPDALSSIILVTTNWDLLHAKNIREGNVNEEQLRNEYWKALLSAGSKMLRFDNTYSSAWNIIDSLPETAISLAIQREMVDEGKGLHDTEAGRSLSSWLQWASQFFHTIIQRLELLLKGIVDASDRNSEETKRHKENLREANEVLKVVNKQEKRLSRSGSVASSVARRLKLRKRKTVRPDDPDNR